MKELQDTFYNERSCILKIDTDLLDYTSSEKLKSKVFKILSILGNFAGQNSEEAKQILLKMFNITVNSDGRIDKD